MPGQEWSRRPRAAVFGVPPLAGHLHSEYVSSPTMGLARWKGVLLRGKRPRRKFSDEFKRGCGGDRPHLWHADMAGRRRVGVTGYAKTGSTGVIGKGSVNSSGRTPGRNRSPACSWFRSVVSRDTPPVSLLAPPPPSSFSGSFPDPDGDAELVFPIVEHSLYPQLGSEGFKVLL